MDSIALTISSLYILHSFARSCVTVSKSHFQCEGNLAVTPITSLITRLDLTAVAGEAGSHSPPPPPGPLLYVLPLKAELAGWKRTAMPIQTGPGFFGWGDMSSHTPLQNLQTSSPNFLIISNSGNSYVWYTPESSMTCNRFWLCESLSPTLRQLRWTPTI